MNTRLTVEIGTLLNMKIALKSMLMTSLFSELLQFVIPFCMMNTFYKNKRAKIWNRYNQAPNLTQDIDGKKVTTSQLDITNESQEVSPFPAGDHKA